MPCAQALEAALAAGKAGDARGLAALRERVRGLVGSGARPEPDVGAQLAEAQGLLQESFRARDALERERDGLARQLAHIAAQARTRQGREAVQTRVMGRLFAHALHASNVCCVRTRSELHARVRL